MRTPCLNILVRELRIDWRYNLPCVFIAPLGGPPFRRAGRVAGFIREYKKTHLTADNGYDFIQFVRGVFGSVASDSEAFRTCTQPDFCRPSGGKA